ncbi:MAG TPA: cupin domain-containing protein [Usitatibacter sp.]|nr:cupin domain-containing protein [Usitatibacter sp.]
MIARKRIGSLDAARFMRRHWQREPLLVRAAFPGFADPLSPREVLALARSPDAESRLVRRGGRSWTVEHGPFAAAALDRLPARDWTLLVQDANHFSPKADALLAAFDFIPHARVDDVMVSYAVPGGGVGPHVDSYDVFLLQGRGRRRWRIARQEDVSFVPGLDLKILRRFEPQAEYVLEAGDMLYLPPGIAHDGVAETQCLTWSIGFRAPADRELVAGFLDYLDERLSPEGQYRDAGSAPAARPGEIPRALEAHVARALRAIRWSGADVREFAGRYLSEPKAHVRFDPPARPLAPSAFARRAARRGLVLDPRARLLFSGTIFFLNGERIDVPAPARAMARRLADRRRLDPPVHASGAFWQTVHAWYLDGFLACQGDEG